jgi:hypothetical protein
VKSPDMLPRTSEARAPDPSASNTHPGSDSPLPLAVVSEGPPLAARSVRSDTLIRVFVDRYQASHGLTADVLAGHLQLSPTVFARYADTCHPPRWLVLAIAGVGIARGIPAEELRWLLDAVPESQSD